MTFSRTNIDYGIGSLPVGEILEPRQPICVEKSRLDDAARLRNMLDPKTTQSDEYAKRFLYSQSEAVLSISKKIAPDLEVFSEKVEYICFKLNESSFQEIEIEMAPDVIPQTWVMIRKNSNGVQVQLEAVSSETTDWLQSITERLASDLCIRLGCTVTVVVCMRHHPLNLYNDVHALKIDQRS